MSYCAKCDTNRNCNLLRMSRCLQLVAISINTYFHDLIEEFSEFNT